MTDRSFNPCFDGSVARGRCTGHAFRIAGSSFNPCFDGSVARGRLLRSKVKKLVPGFQSLF